MELIYYTIAALLLYGISDYILNTIEIKLGKRLPNRSLIFFVIILVLAVSVFSLIQAIFQGPEPVQKSNNVQIKQAPSMMKEPASPQSLPPPTQPGSLQSPPQSQALPPTKEAKE